MSSIYDWSTTASSNGNSDSAIDFTEGQAPSTVNNSARALMGRGAEFVADLGGALAAGGTANGLTVTANSAFTTLVDGRIVAFRATADNTGAATLNVNSIGAKAIRKMDSTGDVALAAGEIQNTGIYVAQYSAALNGGAGAWLLVNPTLSSAVYALVPIVTTDNAAARFDSTAGKLQNSGVIISDLDAITGVTSMTISGSAPVLFLTDTDTGADSFFSASSATGSILISADNGNEVASSDIVFRIDGNALFTFSNAGNLAATSFSGSGTSLTALNASNLSSGTVPDARFPATLPAASGVNLTALNATQLTSGTVPSARISGSYTGITGTGALAAGSIASTFGAIDIGTSALTAGLATFSSNLSAAIGTFSSVVRAGNGAASAPSFSFGSDTNTGFYSYDGDEIGISTAGSFRGNFTNTQLNLGKDSANAATAGLSLGVNGQSISSVEDDTCWILNRIGSDGTIMSIRNDNVTCGTISISGAATAYNESSDEELKDFTGPYDPQEAIAIIRADPVRGFIWNSFSGSPGEYAIGWGAQTSYAVSQDLASPGHGKPGDEDYQPWCIDKGKRTPYLWAALSAALDMIDDLKARVAALEA